MAFLSEISAETPRKLHGKAKDLPLKEVWVSSNLKQNFYSLTADRILDTVESSLETARPHLRLTGQALALNSLENRVYDLQLEDGSSVVAKFYRPHRWSADQIAEEHDFLNRLKAAEIPVVSPLVLSPSKICLKTKSDSLLQTPDGIYFAVFPKVRGRLLDELSDSHLRTLGRYVARIHGIGRIKPFKYRLQVNVNDWGYRPLEEIAKSKMIEQGMASRYREVAEQILEQSRRLLSRATFQVVHGDCHLGNTLWDGESPFFLDFDDAVLAPCVQDIWMIIRGRDEQAVSQRDILLRSYETMNEFQWEDLALIEPLRALRIIHYSAWILRRYEDPCFPQAFPLFGSAGYWRDEIEALSEILHLMQGQNIESPSF